MATLTTPAARTRPARPWWRTAIKPAIYLVGVLPGSWTLYLGLNDHLGADPVKALEHTLGLWALRFLVASLAVTPLRRLGGPNLVLYRRALGLLAFAYALAHVTVYVWLDQDLALRAIVGDILKRPYITIGMLAIAVMVPLAITSNDASIRRLGAAAWQRLHRWVYLGAAAAALHFIMLRKGWQVEPMVYAVIVASLLLLRLYKPARKRARARSAST